MVQLLLKKSCRDKSRQTYQSRQSKRSNTVFVPHPSDIKPPEFSPILRQYILQDLVLLILIYLDPDPKLIEADEAAACHRNMFYSKGC